MVEKATATFWYNFKAELWQEPLIHHFLLFICIYIHNLNPCTQKKKIIFFSKTLKLFK